jgi:surface antigen
MSSAQFVKALLIPVAAVTALAAPLLSASPAAAAKCTADPYTKVCVSTTNATVKTSAGRLSVQTSPQRAKTVRHLAKAAKVRVICQVNNGRKVNGKSSRTWDAIAGGGWVYNMYLTTPRVGADGFSPGIRHCGSGTSVTPGSGSSVGTSYNPSAYPWPTQNGFVSDGHGYYQAECVSFAAWAVRTDGLTHSKSPDFLGNANRWTGAYVDASAQVGDVAQWDGGRNGAGSVGHVAYVVTVNPGGTVTIDEYNWGNFHRLNSRTIAANAPSRYLHF